MYPSDGALLCAVVEQPVSVGIDGSALDFQLYAGVSTRVYIYIHIHLGSLVTSLIIKIELNLNVTRICLGNLRRDVLGQS